LEKIVSTTSVQSDNQDRTHAEFESLRGNYEKLLAEYATQEENLDTLRKQSEIQQETLQQQNDLIEAFQAQLQLQQSVVEAANLSSMKEVASDADKEELMRLQSKCERLTSDLEESQRKYKTLSLQFETEAQRSSLKDQEFINLTQSLKKLEEEIESKTTEIASLSTSYDAEKSRTSQLERELHQSNEIQEQALQIQEQLQHMLTQSLAEVEELKQRLNERSETPTSETTQEDSWVPITPDVLSELKSTLTQCNSLLEENPLLIQTPSESQTQTTQPNQEDHSLLAQLELLRQETEMQKQLIEKLREEREQDLTLLEQTQDLLNEAQETTPPQQREEANEDIEALLGSLAKESYDAQQALLNEQASHRFVSYH